MTQLIGPQLLISLASEEGGGGVSVVADVRQDWSRDCVHALATLINTLQVKHSVNFQGTMPAPL